MKSEYESIANLVNVEAVKKRILELRNLGTLDCSFELVNVNEYEDSLAATLYDVEDFEAILDEPCNFVAAYKFVEYFYNNFATDPIIQEITTNTVKFCPNRRKTARGIYSQYFTQFWVQFDRAVYAWAISLTTGDIQNVLGDDLKQYYSYGFLVIIRGVAGAYIFERLHNMSQEIIDYINERVNKSLSN